MGAGAGAGCGTAAPVGALVAEVGSLMATGSGAATMGALVRAFLICVGAGGDGNGSGVGVGVGGRGGGSNSLGLGGSINCDITTTGTTNSTARFSRPLYIA